ncbi:MAG: hypothetical protein ISR58_08950 [Anaerolineales bacterium]|nr:hypothetical protein [Chloroflexota bacterium]MBL6981305.1 hypothetical protein [Anaerolineales bacterium]
MWYATLEIGRIYQQEAINAVQQTISCNPSTSDRVIAGFGKLLVALGQRLQTRQQYGTVLHAG